MYLNLYMFCGDMKNKNKKMKMDDLRVVVGAVAVVLALLYGGGHAQLSYDFHQKSCPQLEDIVKTSFATIFLADPTTPAALLRLMFHDCQVQGCDASILVDPSEQDEHTEMVSGKNFGIRKRNSIDFVKSVVEEECPQQVSCADIVILAAREAVAVSGGPRIKVPLGRRDSSTIPSSELADASLPPATIGVDGMLRVFAAFGMSVEEAVAILGSHTLGVTHCLNVVNRLYKGEGGDAKLKGMEAGFEAFLKLTCPKTSVANSSFVVNDLTTFSFDNLYYTNAKGGRGVLSIDAEMAIDPQTAPVVQRFSQHQDEFFRVFSSAFVKLSISGVLTGNEGVIRKNCNALN